MYIKNTNLCNNKVCFLAFDLQNKKEKLCEF